MPEIPAFSDGQIGSLAKVLGECGSESDTAVAPRLCVLGCANAFPTCNRVAVEFRVGSGERGVGM